MKYRRDIKIFRLKEDINLPLQHNPNKVANCNIGDLLICYDGNNVYCRDRNENDEGNYSLLLNDLRFIEVNKLLFEEITNI